MVALFFILFSMPAFLFLPGDEKSGTSIIDGARNGLKTTLTMFKKIMSNKEQRRFLLAYLIYEDGVNTAIVFSGIFAATTLKFQPAGTGWFISYHTGHRLDWCFFYGTRHRLLGT